MDLPETAAEWSGTHEYVLTNKMFPDPSYQRPEIRHHVAEITADVDQLLFGSVILSARPRGGRFAIIDGYQRWSAARALGIEEVPATVHRGLSVAEEADKFVKLQRRRLNVKPVYRYRAELVAEHEWAVESNRILLRHGISVVESSGKNAPPEALSAVVALEWIYGRYGSAGLANALSTVIASWPGIRGRFRGEILKAVAQFIADDDPEIPLLIWILGSSDAKIGHPDALMDRSAQLRNAMTGGRGLGGGSTGYTTRVIRTDYKKLNRRARQAVAAGALPS